MQKLTTQMSSALGNMDLVKVTDTMGNFEKMFDNLDVNAEFMDRAMDNVSAGMADEKDVNQLIGQVAEEFNMKLEGEFAEISTKNKETGIKEGQKQQAVNSNLNN